MFAGINAKQHISDGELDEVFFLTMNPRTKGIMITGIPGKTSINKNEKTTLRTYYHRGGIIKIKKVLEEAFQLRIDGYVKLNVGLMKEIVSRIGNLSVNVPYSFTFQGSSFEKGHVELTPEQARAYCRMEDPFTRGSLDKVKRQQQIMFALIQEGTKPFGVLRTIPIIKDLREEFRTSIPLMDMIHLIYRYHGVKLKHVEMNQLQVSDMVRGNPSYCTVKGEELEKMRQAITRHKEKKRQRPL
jgi:LCP family protein required for cell wall assembly